MTSTEAGPGAPRTFPSTFETENVPDREHVRMLIRVKIPGTSGKESRKVVTRGRSRLWTISVSFLWTPVYVPKMSSCLPGN